LTQNKITQESVNSHVRLLHVLINVMMK